MRDGCLDKSLARSPKLKQHRLGVLARSPKMQRHHPMSRVTPPKREKIRLCQRRVATYMSCRSTTYHASPCITAVAPVITFEASLIAGTHCFYHCKATLLHRCKNQVDWKLVRTSRPGIPSELQVQANRSLQCKELDHFGDLGLKAAATW